MLFMTLRRTTMKVGLLLWLAAGLAGPAAAQTLPLTIDTPVPGVTAYDPAIPTPMEVLGHTIGEKHTPPHEVVTYFQAVAAASDRVVLGTHGRTYEGRPLIHAFITSPANHARLEDIRRANVRLSEEPTAVRDADLAAQPAVVYMGYSIHGNEASGTEAGLLLLYHLAAGQGPGVEAVLSNTVVILDPLFNPDGRDRFADWVNRNRGGVPTSDPQDREHNEPWPGGRTNHYWFDLNRDWLPAAHPESRGRIELFHRWRPQVLTDYHEMGSDATYFFQPGIPSRTNPNTPALNQELTAEIAAYHARYLDRIGSLYYTEESFDDFYYGKGSTFPDVNGAVGILFEQASSRALQRETENGLLTYAFTVRNQFTASLSTLEAVVNLRERLLRYQRDFYAQAPEVARSSPVKGYVVSLAEGRTRAQRLAQMLQQHRIRVHDLARRVEVDGVTYEPGEAYIVPVDQPQARLIKGIMETMTTFEDSLFYDVSTWTLPLAFNVTYAELRENVARLVGPEQPPVDLDGGRLVGGRTNYAYLIEWGRYLTPRALYRLQDAGVRVRLMREAFSAVTGGERRTFSAGTLVVPVLQQEVPADEIHRLIEQAVAEDHVVVYATETGLTPGGPDLGSRNSLVLEKPSIALLTGSGTSSYNAGEVWHLLSERFRVPVSLLDVEDVARADLGRYNTLVLAGGSYAGLPADKVRDWVRGGGRLVALTSGADWAVRNGLADLEAREADLDSLLRGLPYDQLERARGAQAVGGAIFEARVDPTHPLAYGYGPRVPLFRNDSGFYAPSDEPGANVAVYTDDPLLSGYISEERLAELRGSAAIVGQRLGRGRVILIMDNPNFRAFWYGTNGFFLNAVFLGGAF